MLRYVKDQDILQADVDFVVNPVNCKGIMGAGLAKQMKRKYEFFTNYDEVCRAGILKPGDVVLSRFTFYPSVIHIATKDDWRDPSKIEWIARGVDNLKAEIERAIKEEELTVVSVAIPQIGCGLGGLSWADVFPIIEDAFHDVPYKVVVYL